MITGYYRVDEKMITFETLSDVSNYSLTKQVNIFFSNWEAYYIPQFRSLCGELFVFAIQFWQKKLQNCPKFPLTHIGLFNRVKERAIEYSYPSQESLTIGKKFHLQRLKVGFHV